MDAVECRSDTEFAERPLAILWQGSRLEVAEVLARWRGPRERGFRVKTTNGQAFELTYRELEEEWKVSPI